MSRKMDVAELIAEVDHLIEHISEIYLSAVNDQSINSLPRVKVKSALEHLRSALDYCALDIYEKFYGDRNGKRIYFPYADNENKFIKNANEIFPKLEVLNIAVFKLVESIQPHQQGSITLTRLCKLTNQNKHDQLSTQNRNQSPGAFEIGKAIHFSGYGGTASFHGCTIGEIPMGRGHTVTIKPSMSKQEIVSQLNPDLDVPVVRSLGKVKFMLEGNGVDSLELLVNSRALVSNFSERLYSILN